MDDLRYALHGIDTTFYNASCIGCQQVAEKLLKHVIVIEVLDQDPLILKTHNLKKLVRYINNQRPKLIKDTKDLDILSTFYFDARYPGSEFIIAEASDAKESFTTVLTLYKIISSIVKVDPEDYLDADKYLLYLTEMK